MYSKNWTTHIMDFFKNITLLIFIAISSLLFGCNTEKVEPEISEKDVAKSFFNAVYNEKDFQKALSFSTGSLKQELQKYRTAKNIARRVFEMSFDSVSLHTSAMKTQIINEYNIQVTMMVQFSGERNGGNYKDYKKIRLIKENNKWLIDKLIKDD